MVFDKWVGVLMFRDTKDGMIWKGRKVRIDWDREAEEIQVGTGKKGEYPMDISEDERNTIMII